MTRYIVTALSQKQHLPASHFVVAVSVTDTNGSGVPHLNESNFAVNNLTDASHMAIADLHATDIPGIYTLTMQMERTAKAGEYILALAVAGRHQPVGRMPAETSGGQTLVKVKMLAAREDTSV